MKKLMGWVTHKTFSASVEYGATPDDIVDDDSGSGGTTQMYSYNGMVSSALPEWDKDKLPHAVMVLYDYSTGSMLGKVDKLVVYFLSEITITNDLYDSDGTYKDFVWYADGDQWVRAERAWDSTGVFSAFGDIETHSGESLKFSLENVVWTNTDLYTTDNIPYMAASEPIPVYE